MDERTDFTHLDTCAYSGKKCMTYAQARFIIAKYAKSRRRKVPRRAYMCYECGWWHVTSQKHRGDRRYEKRWL